MTDSQTVTEGQGTTQVVEAEVEAATPAAKKGTEFLDFDKLPPEIAAEVKPRFDHLYKHVKEGNRRADLLDAHAKALEKRIDDLWADNERLRSGTQAQQSADEITGLKTKIKEANAQGNYDLAVELTEKLVEAKQKKPEAKQRPVPVEVDTTETLINGWAAEKDETGAVKRPWAQPGHRMQKSAANLTMALIDHPRFEGKPIQDVLDEVDRQMGGGKPKPAPQPTQATVIGNSGDSRPRPSAAPKLEAPQRYVAEKMFPNLPAKEAHARYAKGLATVAKEA